jgi:hypothetical protein
MVPSQRYFCPIILESSLPEHQELNRRKFFIANNLSTVSSSADSGVHSTYTQSPRYPLDQDNTLYATYDETRYHQYSLV